MGGKPCKVGGGLQLSWLKDYGKKLQAKDGKFFFFSVALHSLDYHTHAVHTHRQSQYIKFDFFQKVSVTLWCVTV